MAVYDPDEYYGQFRKNITKTLQEKDRKWWYDCAKEMRYGTGKCFKYFQDINYILTGNCLALLP